MRAGVALGPALQRAGDYYGHAVNLASRVTGRRAPGSVLCTEEVRDGAPDRFDWSFARKHKLKGMSEAVPLYRARRRADASGAAMPPTRAPTRPLRRTDRKQIDDEHERRVRRDRRRPRPPARRPGSAGMISSRRPPTFMPGDALHPARDHAAGASAGT